MDDWEKFNKTSPCKKKKRNYSHLGMGDITDGGYTYGKSVYKDFEIGIFENTLYACLSRCIWKLLKYVSWNILILLIFLLHQN